jgi:hypothetical protein
LAESALDDEHADDPSTRRAVLLPLASIGSQAAKGAAAADGAAASMEAMLK